MKSISKIFNSIVSFFKKGNVQNQEKSLHRINITMPIYGLDGIIIKTIEQQHIIEQELK